MRQKISAGCSGYKLTPEQREKHLAGIRLWVSSPDYKNPRKGQHHSDETKDKLAISSSVTGAAYPKIRSSMEKNGHWIPLAQLPAVVKYRREVWKHTNKNAHLIPNYDSTKRGRCSKEHDTWQIDHKLSILQGWLDGVSPEVLSHLMNLRFIPWRENLQKWHNSTLTREELLNRICTI